MSNNSSPVLEALDLHKTYRQGKQDVSVLKGVNFSVGAGESHAIVGVSGAGKSTLMHLLGGLDHSSGGDIRVAGQAISGLSESKLGDLRNRHLGFIYQFHHLLPEFSARENIAMPLLVRRQSRQQANASADEWLERVGLQHRGEHKPGELSGGERQRVALARALVTRPDCLLAEQMLNLMLDLNKDINTALVIVTHDLGIAAKMQYQWRMLDGLLERESQEIGS